MKRILVTGENSYIGNAFRDYMMKFPEYVVDTISVRDGAWRIMDFSVYDAIFHVAGIVHLNMKKISAKQRNLYYKVNTDLTIELAQKAKQEGVGQFIFMSSASVYGDGAAVGKKKIITIDTPPSPTNFYGDSKMRAEEGLQKLESYFFKVVILRPPMIYGKGCRGNYLALVKLARKFPVFPKIYNHRSMCYIGNLVEFVRLMVENEESGIFWPCNGELSNTSELVRMIAAAHGRKVWLVPGCTWGLKLIGKINGSVDKAFGNFIYEKTLGEYKVEYRKYGVEESIWRTERRTGENEVKRALIVASVASMIDQFNMQNIKLLKELGYYVDVACNFVEGNTCSAERIEQLKEKLKEDSVGCFQVDFARDVLKVGQNARAYKQLKTVAKKRKYELIHCHTPIGGVLGRVVFRKYRKMGTRVIYTAHGFHFFKGAPVKNWVLYFPVEKFLSRWTDCLITINKEDYKRAKEKFHAKRTEYVPGVGVDTKKFNSELVDISEKRESLGISDNDIMLLSVGELSIRNNHEIVIRALKKLNNPKIKYFIAGQGELLESLSLLIKNHGLEDKIFLLGYRTDISELCQIADLFVLSSKQEGLSVALMEAIACKTPVICSKIRGNVELIQNEKSMFDADNVDDLVDCLGKNIGNKNRKEFRQEKVREIIINYKNLLSYDLTHVQTEMNGLYCAGGRIINLLRRQNFAKKLKVEAENIFILSVGELNENKNHSLIIRAIAMLKDQSVHYVIIGKGRLQNKLRNLAVKLDVEGQVHLLGFRNDVAEIMKLVDLYCLPSLREGLNVSLLEAMASGLPCIAGDIRGNRDLFDKDIKGQLLPVDTPKIWAKGIKKCILCLEEEQENTRRFIKKIDTFSKDSVEKRTKEIYSRFARK